MKTNLFDLKSTALALGIFFSTLASAQFTAVTSGDWSNSVTWGGTAPSSNVSNQNITIPAGITVNLDADVTFTGLLNTFSVNGVLTNTTQNGVFMTSGNLAGTGTVSIGKLNFSLLGTTSYAGMLTVKHMMNSVGTLSLTSIINVSDTLELYSGNLSLNTNANLTMATGSTVKINDGILVINSGVFNSANAYNVMYVGTSKNVGVELNSTSVQNLYLNLSDNAQSVKLMGNSTINGDIKLSSGTLDINGKKLTLKGDFTASSGTSFYSNNSNSDFEIQGSGMLSNPLAFSTASSLHDFTINRTGNGMVKLANHLDILGHLNLTEGTLSVENSGTLSMNAASTVHVEKGMIVVNLGAFVGTSSYDVEYMGSTDATSQIELTGTGLHNVTINYTGASNKLMLSNNTTVAGKLSVMNGKLDLNGKNLILNGTFDQSSSSWITGNANSELHLNLTSVNQNTLYFDNTNSSSQSLSKLKINISGSNNIMLGSKLIVANELAFVAGKLELGNGDLEIMSAASITGYDDTKYVVTSSTSAGVLIQNVNSGSAYVTFPIGLSSEYSPAYVQQNATGTSGNFSAKCQTLYSASLKAVNRTWYVEGAGVTTVDANLKFGWKAIAEMNAFDRTNAYVSHFTSGMWDLTASSSATAGVNGTFELSRMGLTSLSPFAVIESGQPVGIKEISKLSGIELFPNPSKDALNIKVANSSDEYQYEIIDVTGRTILTASNTNSVNKFDVSGLGSGCYFVKITNLTENKTTTKRFVKQ